jgi:hemerythrin
MITEVLPKFVWSDEYSIGIVSIDNQHKHILSEITNILEMSDSDRTRQVLKGAVENLEQIVNVHNKYEERLMRQYNYPELQSHAREHKVFTNNISVLKNALLTYGFNEKLLEMILAQVTAWHDEHLLKCDRELGQFLVTENIH